MPTSDLHQRVLACGFALVLILWPEQGQSARVHSEGKRCTGPISVVT